MKKNSLLLILIFSFCLISCSKKSQKIGERKTVYGELAFNLGMYSLCGECQMPDISKYYCPEEIKKFTGHYIYNNGKFIRALDFYFPQKACLTDYYLFYIPQTEKGEWLTSVINGVEERRIASAINDLLDNDITAPFDENVSAQKAMETVKTVEKLLIDSRNRLNSLEYGDEILFSKNKLDNELISSSKNKVTRKFYDDKWRLIKLENWNINGVKDSSRILYEEYFYDEDSFNPYQKVSVSSDEKTVNTYENGKISESAVYKIIDQKEYIQSKMHWTFDDEGKIITETAWTYYYKKSNAKKLDSVFKKMQKYSYKNVEECPPDYTYYENDRLKMKTVYFSKGDYETTLYFDENLSVTGIYKNNIHIKDIFYRNGEKIRTENYE